MKKLTTLLVLLLFTAGMAFGQAEDPDDFNNFAYIDQASDGNIAEVQQVGANNTVLLPTQGGSFGGLTFQGEAYIDQLGNNNYVGINQGGSDKVGESFADIIMDGNNNFIGRDGGIANQQGGFLTADILGSSNVIDIDAEQQNSKAYFEITGDGNIIDLFQKSWGGAEQNQHEFDATIHGSDNIVDLYQGNFGTTLGNRALLDISGSANEVSISQGNSDLAFPAPGSTVSNYNYTEVNVDGNNNTASVVQGYNFD